MVKTRDAFWENKAAARTVLPVAGPGWEKLSLQTKALHTLGDRSISGLRGSDGGGDVVDIAGEALIRILKAEG
jgi:hypothetical protein